LKIFSIPNLCAKEKEEIEKKEKIAELEKSYNEKLKYPNNS
jgi:hypothetical protein